MGDEEMAAAFAIERLRNLHRAKSIGIRLDDGCGARRRQEARKLAVVAAESAKVDVQIAGCAGRIGLADPGVDDALVHAALPDHLAHAEVY